MSGKPQSKPQHVARHDPEPEPHPEPRGKQTKRRAAERCAASLSNRVKDAILKYAKSIEFSKESSSGHIVLRAMKDSHTLAEDIEDLLLDEFNQPLF